MNAFWLRLKTANPETSPRFWAKWVSPITLYNSIFKRLTARGLVVKEKMAANSLGRPKFAYHVPSAATKQVNAALENPYVGL